MDSRLANAMTIAYFCAMAVLGAIGQSPTVILNQLPHSMIWVQPLAAFLAFGFLAIGVFSWLGEKVVGPRTSIGIGVVGSLILILLAVRSVRNTSATSGLETAPSARQSAQAATGETPRPAHEITLDQGLELIRGLSRLEGTCIVKITAAPENLDVRQRLVSLFLFTRSLPYVRPQPTPEPNSAGPSEHGPRRNRNRFFGFDIPDDARDSQPPNPLDADAPKPESFPSNEVLLIYAQDSGQVSRNGNDLLELLQRLGLQMRFSHQLPLGASPDVVYIQIGRGWVWR